MVTAAAADGLVPSSSGSAREEEAEGLQDDIVSMAKSQHIAMHQSIKLLPGRLEFLRLSLAHQPTALRHQRQSVGQLHALVGGVGPTRFSFSPLLRPGAHILGGYVAAQGRSDASPLCLNSGTGEEVVRSGDVRPRRVAAVQLCMSLPKVLRLCNGVNEDIFNKKEVEYSLVWADFVRRIMLARVARRPHPAALAELAGARLHRTTPLRTCERDQRGRCTRNPSDGAAGLVGLGVCKMRT
jgi:hypothetical protein